MTRVPSQRPRCKKLQCSPSEPQFVQSSCRGPRSWPSTRFGLVLGQRIPQWLRGGGNRLADGTGFLNVEEALQVRSCPGQFISQSRGTTHETPCTSSHRIRGLIWKEPSKQSCAGHACLPDYISDSAFRSSHPHASNTCIMSRRDLSWCEMW